MGVSPSHRFGQFIGEILEAAVIPLLDRFAKDHNLYFDKQGSRPCRRGKKCSWIDLNKNSHDLDFVFERGGTPDRTGIPAAFIEVAWRRYTKHSRNKVQEIQGAILPLVETYRNAAPFQGAILAGVFTKAALAQLESLGFTVLYFPYDTVVNVFKEFGIDATYDEHTLDEVFLDKVKASEALKKDQRQALAAKLLSANATDVAHFIASMTKVVSRQVERIIVLPLHGSERELVTVEGAIEFVTSYVESASVENFQHYEIQVRYNNENRIDGTFRDKESAIEFLRLFA